MNKNNKFHQVGVIGGGAWGTALAIKAAENQANVTLFCREAILVESINQLHLNNLYLPEVNLPRTIKATIELDDLLTCDLLLISLPTQSIRQFIEQNLDFKPKQPVLLCSKGIENETLKCLTEVVLELWDVSIMVLSGPNFAKEVALGCYTSTEITGIDENLLIQTANTFASKSFDIYLNNDPIGVQILAAAKNVIAIGAGLCAGAALGENCRAALITRCLDEAHHLLLKVGGKSQTVNGLAGIGDLLLTATSSTSRNTDFGYNLGQGIKITALLDKTVEGYYTSKALFELGSKHNCQMPILEAIYKILYQNYPIDELLTALNTSATRR
jgi:glycerol-3-phosphate dehydrogenase (NAD(P)+)